MTGMGAVSEYISTLAEPSRVRIDGLMKRAAAAVPDADEGMSYGMAALRYRGRPLVSVVTSKQGYTVYPFSPNVVAAVLADIEGFDSTKGGIRFSEDQPLPDSALDALVRGRREEIDAALTRG